MQTAIRKDIQHICGLMTHFITRGSSVQDVSAKPAVQQNVCAVSSVRDRISALQGSLSGSADTASSSHTPKPDFRKISIATPILNIGLSSLRVQSFKPAETQRHTDFSSMPSLPKKLVMKSEKSQKPNYITTCGSQNKFQLESTDPSVPKRRSLPDLLALGSPPPKPERPLRVDIHQFIRDRTSSNDGSGTKIPHPVAPPPLRSCRPSNHAAALSQQLVIEEIYDDCTMNPPLLPLKGHPSNRTEADLRKKLNEELPKRWIEQAEKSKNHQKSNCGKEDTNHGEVPEKKQAEPEGTIGSEEMKGQDIKAKKEEKKHQKTKEKKKQEAKKKFKIKEPVHMIENGKRRGEEIIHNEDDYVKTESVDTSHDDLKHQDGTQNQSDTEYEDYDDIGAIADSGLVAQNSEADDIYDDVDDPETRSVLITPHVKEDCIYEVN